MPRRPPSALLAESLSRICFSARDQKNFLRDLGFVKDFDYQAWIVGEPLAFAERLVAEENGHRRACEA
jgi:hypothetical protein